MTKDVFCLNKYMFSMTNPCLSWQNFVTTKMIVVAAPANDIPWAVTTAQWGVILGVF